MERVTDSTHEIKRKFEIKREALQMEAIADHDLDHMALRVWVAITAKYWNRNTGEAFPSVRTLAREINWSPSSVDRGIRTLVERGYLALVGKRGLTHVYAVRCPNMMGQEKAQDTVPTSWDGVSQHPGTGCPTQAGTQEPLTEPLIEPLTKTSLRSEDKKEDGERGLRPREQGERPSSHRETPSFEPKHDSSAPVLIDTPEQKARVEAMREHFHQITKTNRMPRGRAMVPGADDELRLAEAMVTHGRRRLNNLSQRLDGFRPREAA
jgi:hypothetical protein